MKKLVIKIGNERHELPYNDEVFSFEVSEKYVPKIGDCVMVDPKEILKPTYTSSPEEELLKKKKRKFR